MQKTAPKTRSFTGVVTSDKMDKTITVAVTSAKMHEKYRKQYLVTTKFHVHDQKEEAKVGDTVRFIEVRPLSRTKRWKLAEIIKNN